jgi:hypothetical protein
LRVADVSYLPGGRLLNVALAPGLAMPERLGPVLGSAADRANSAALAAGFRLRPAWNLSDFGGRTIADLVFVNVYVGSAGA